MENDNIDINNSVEKYGPEFVGYPHILEGSSYTKMVGISNEKDDFVYHPSPTDDLSKIWHEKFMLNDMSFMTDDINTYNINSYGAKELNEAVPLNADVNEFSRFLKPNPRASYEKPINTSSEQYITNSVNDSVNDSVNLNTTNNSNYFNKSNFLILILIFLLILSVLYSQSTLSEQPVVPLINKL